MLTRSEEKETVSNQTLERSKAVIGRERAALLTLLFPDTSVWALLLCLKYRLRLNQNYLIGRNLLSIKLFFWLNNLDYQLISV